MKSVNLLQTNIKNLFHFVNIQSRDYESNIFQLHITIYKYINLCFFCNNILFRKMNISKHKYKLSIKNKTC